MRMNNISIFFYTFLFKKINTIITFIIIFINSYFIKKTYKIIHFVSSEYFNYPSKQIFIKDLELLLEQIYPDIKFNKESNSRPSQNEFRNNVIEQYGGKCIITNNTSLEELEASHIVEVKDYGDYSLNNGLLLEANLHKTFDRYYWSINPDTLEIESAPKNITNSIKNYIGKKVSIQMNPFLYTNLKKRYEIFLSKCDIME